MNTILQVCKTIVFVSIATALAIASYCTVIVVDHNNRVDAGAYSYLLDGTLSISQVNTTDQSSSWMRDVTRTHLEREAVVFYSTLWQLSRSTPQGLRLPLPTSLVHSGALISGSLVLLHAALVIMMLRRHYRVRNDHKPYVNTARMTWHQLYGGLPRLCVLSSLAGLVSGTYILLIGWVRPGMNSYRIEPELDATLFGVIAAASIGLPAWIDRARKAINGLSHDGFVHCECGFRFVGEQREYHLLRCPECGTPVTQTTGQVRIPRYIRLLVRCTNVAAIAIAMLCIAIHVSSVQTTATWRRMVDTLAGGNKIAYVKVLTDDLVALSYRVDNETHSVVLYLSRETRPRTSSMPGSVSSFIYGRHGQIQCRYLKFDETVESLDRTKLESMLKIDGQEFTWPVDVGEHGQFSSNISLDNGVELSVIYTVNYPEFIQVMVNTSVTGFDRWRSGTRYDRDD